MSDNPAIQPEYPQYFTLEPQQTLTAIKQSIGLAITLGDDQAIRVQAGKLALFLSVVIRDQDLEKFRLAVRFIAETLLESDAKYLFKIVKKSLRTKNKAWFNDAIIHILNHSESEGY